MKKIYYLVAAMLLSGATVAQTGAPLEAQKTQSTNVVAHHNTSYNRAPGDTIGTVMNFSTPADWVINNSGVTGTGWVIGTTGPSGFFSGGMGEIASTSGGNFAMFDADGNTGTGIITMANSVDLSTFTNVALEFESYYRNFQGDCFAEVSTNGTTWTTYPVHSLVLLNESTANPELVSINISATAAGQSTVWVRFRYMSADDYAWMIDDVKLVEGYNDNLILNQTFLSSGVEALDYYRIPVSQIQPFTFGAWVENGGVNDQASTILNVKVNNGTTDVYNQSSTPGTVPAYSSDSLELVTPTWTPTAGTYTVTYTVSSSATDEAPANNVMALQPIAVGGNIYARDNGIVTGSVGHLGSTPVPTSMGNFFEFVNDFNFGRIQIGVSSTSLAGELIFGEVRLYDGSEFVVVETTADYILQAGDLGNIITLNLNNPVNCQNGQLYYIGAAHYGGTVRVQTAQVAEGALIYNNGAASTQNSVFIVRAEEVFLGVEESDLVNGLTAYPNPAGNNVTVDYNLTQTAKVELTVVDVTGKVVLSNDFGTQTAGNYKTNVNTSVLSNGVYFYTLTVDGAAITQKLTVSNN